MITEISIWVMKAKLSIYACLNPVIVVHHPLWQNEFGASDLQVWVQGLSADCLPLLCGLSVFLSVSKYTRGAVLSKLHHSRYLEPWGGEDRSLHSNAICQPAEHFKDALYCKLPLAVKIHFQEMPQAILCDSGACSQKCGLRLVNNGNDDQYWT